MLQKKHVLSPAWSYRKASMTATTVKGVACGYSLSIDASFSLSPIELLLDMFVWALVVAVCEEQDLGPR